MRPLVLVAGLVLVVFAVTASATSFSVSPSVLFSTIQSAGIDVGEPPDDECLPSGPPHDPPGPPHDSTAPPTAPGQPPPGDAPPLDPPGPPCEPPAPPFDPAASES